MSIDIEAVRARAEEFRGAKGYTRAGAAHASAEDVPALLDEVERLGADARYASGRLLASDTEVERLGRRVQSEHEDYVTAMTLRQEAVRRAERAEAERDRLRAAVDAVRNLANKNEAWAKVAAEEYGDIDEAEDMKTTARAIHAALDEHLGEG